MGKTRSRNRFWNRPSNVYFEFQKRQPMKNSSNFHLKDFPMKYTNSLVCGIEIVA